MCCFSPAEAYVPVLGTDWARLGGTAAELAHFIGHRAFMRMRDGHCVALEILSLPDGSADFFCRIYDHRPQVCRDLERGSPQCGGERARNAAPTGAGGVNSASPTGSRLT